MDKAQEVEKSIREDFREEGGINSLAQRVYQTTGDVEGDTEYDFVDIRLRYFEGHFYFYTGDASYDTDHRGSWGASSVARDTDKEDCLGIAVDLLERVLDAAVECVA